MPTFMEMVAHKQRSVGRFCGGVDPILEKIAPTGQNVVDFCRIVIEASVEQVAVFKPNIAFFEDRGARGLEEYLLVIEAIQKVDSAMPIIGDWKRGDIGASNDGYQRAEIHYGINAMTASPYLGQETWQKFLNDGSRGLIVLCRTSNPGAREFQNLPVDVREDPILGKSTAPLYQIVARNVARNWNTLGNCGLVVGATAPEEIKWVRQIAPSVFLLVPGVGSQGGDRELAVAHALSADAEADFVINSSGSWMFAYEKGEFACDPAKFGQAAAAYAKDLNQKINQDREATLAGMG